MCCANPRVHPTVHSKEVNSKRVELRSPQLLSTQTRTPFGILDVSWCRLGCAAAQCLDLGDHGAAAAQWRDLDELSAEDAADVVQTDQVCLMPSAAASTVCITYCSNTAANTSPRITVPSELRVCEHRYTCCSI